MFVVDIGPQKIAATLHKESIPTMCLHCDQPECLAVCPSGAIYREADGTVQVDAGSCNGCAACQGACPFGVIEEHPTGGKMVKCTLCFARREAGGIPSCAQHCVGRAFTMATQLELDKVIGGRYSWTRGRVVYVSSKWASLGKELGAATDKPV
jgi:Fe-S-cluster-containing dehydrogenase component